MHEMQMLNVHLTYRYTVVRNAANALFCCAANHDHPEAVDMNGRFQMQGGKNWILPK
jgi:hypothetical protein